MADLVNYLSQMWPVQMAKAAWNASPWLNQAEAQAQADATAYQRGGVPALMANTGDTQDLAGAFVGSTEVPKGIRAFHGSPYDFEKFDLSKVGTGEGAQAYGHGLYFAENPEVARQYKENLSPRHQTKTLVNGIPMEDLPSDLYRLAFSHWNTGAPSLKGTPLEAAKFEIKRPGHMYEVNINARPEHFLSWDKPLSEQPASLQAAVKGKTMPIGGENPPGNYAYYALGNSAPQASAAAEKLGVPGIRYLDRGSRGAGNGSYNYVVFNPAIVDILRKFGIFAAPAGLAGATAYNQRQQ